MYNFKNASFFDFTKKRGIDSMKYWIIYYIMEYGKQHPIMNVKENKIKLQNAKIKRKTQKSI